MKIAALVDDRAVDARLDHQLPHPKHARRRRADHPAGPAHHRAAVLRGSSATFQGAIMLQPICGYVLDVVGLKAGLRDVRDRLVVRQHGARPGPQLAGVRGAARAARLRRRLRQPGRHEGDGGMVSRQGARPRRRPLQHRRVGRLDARAAARRLGDPQLQLAGGVRDHRPHRARVGGAVAGVLPLARSPSRSCPPPSATTSSRARSSTSQETDAGRRSGGSCGSGISGASRCRASSPIRPGAR